MSQQSSNNRGIKKLSEAKYLFFLNSKDIYYITFESIDLTNIEIILIKLCPKETYVYKNIIHFQNLGTNDCSPQDTLKNIDFFIYNFDFTISEQLNKYILTINNKSKTNIDLFLFNKNMEKNNMKKFLEKKNIIDGLQNRVHELISITSNQKKKIDYLKEKEKKQINLINKIEEVTNGISNQYKNRINNINNNNNNIQQQNINNNNNNNFNNIKNNFNNQQNPEKKLLRTIAPQRFNNNFDMDLSNKNNLNNNNMNNMNKQKQLNVTVNIKYSPYLPNNANMDNLLTRPQNIYPNQPQQNLPKTKAINLDDIQDYRYK